MEILGSNVGNDVVHDVSLLDRLDPETLGELREAGTLVAVRAGDWLFRAGDDGDAVYIVESGRLEVLGDGEGPGSSVRFLGAGDVVGELALVCRRPRSASVRATRDSTLQRIAQADCARLVEAGGPFALALLATVGEKLRASLDEAAHSTVPKVVAVVPLDDAAAGPSIASAITSELRTWGSVAELGVQEPPVDAASWGSTLDAIERDHDFVVLLGSPPDERRLWSDFCARQADRVLGVVTRPPGTAPRQPSWDLVTTSTATTVSARRRWIDVLQPRAHHSIRPGHERADVGRALRRVFGRSVGLVLSGGGARGLAHLGVIDELRRAGLVIDRVGGTSMGAFVAALFATGHSPTDMTRLCRTELVERHPFRDFRWPKVSLIRARRAEAMLQRVFGAAHLEDLLLSCFAVSADLTSAEVVVHRRGLVVDAVGASMSLPGLAPPVRDGSRLLVDGGVLNNVPVDVMAATDEGPIVAVDVMTRSPLGPPQRMPSIVETLARATVIGSHHQAAERLGFARAVVTPDVGSIGLLDFTRFDAIVDAGHRAARQMIDAGSLPVS